MGKKDRSKEIIGTGEASEILGVPMRTVRYLARKEKIPTIQAWPKAHLRFKRSDIEVLKEKLTNPDNQTGFTLEEDHTTTAIQIKPKIENHIPDEIEISSAFSVNKLAKVINAIEEARQITPKGNDVKVYIKDANGLTSVYAQEIKDVLTKLQDDEKVITLVSFPEWLLPYTKNFVNGRMGAILDPSVNHFVVRILDNFNKVIRNC